MPHPAYETPDRRKWNTYYQFLKSGPAKLILDAYAAAGGDASHLRMVLWDLRERDYPPVIPDLTTLKAMQRLVRGLEAIPAMSGLKGVDESLWKELTAVTPLRDKLQAYVDHLPTQTKLRDMRRSINKMTRPLRKLTAELKRPPRTRGYETKTLIAAALVEEFKHRKMYSRYRKAAILLREAFPDKKKGFGKLSNEMLGRLVWRIPQDIRERERARLFEF
ncbi:MAG: hypothetical protein K8G79_12670 [bacterium]|uniref:Uncharacterized protein n=1 Tax=Candidatus Methylomirabilis tolerans TaxID=3123416 RepID=A0AAJ1EU83_9BACT|nr:hypothetical protein [Candidatus Methylomirabilis sp.]